MNEVFQMEMYTLEENRIQRELGAWVRRSGGAGLAGRCRAGPGMGQWVRGHLSVLASIHSSYIDPGTVWEATHHSPCKGCSDQVATIKDSCRSNILIMTALSSLPTWWVWPPISCSASAILGPHHPCLSHQSWPTGKTFQGYWHSSHLFMP